MGSVWRIAAKLKCHDASSFLSPFPTFSSASSQDRVVLDIIPVTGADLGAMAMVAQATILGMKGAVQITMEIMGVQATILGMEAIMEEVVQTTMAIMAVQAIILVGVAITMVVDPITMAGQVITLADLTTMATMEDQA